MAGKIDDESGAAVVIGIEQNRVREGGSFVSTYKTPDASPLADNGEINFLFITDGSPPNVAFEATGNDDLEIALFERTTVSDNGTQLAIVNLNRRSARGSHVTAWLNPTITDDGDRLYTAFSSWSTGIQTAKPVLEWILKGETCYLVRVINRAGVVQPVSLIVQWN